MLLLGQDVGHPLVGRRQCHGFLALAEGMHGADPACKVERPRDRAGAYGQVHFDGNAFVLGPGTETVEHVVEDVIDQSLGLRQVAMLGCGQFEKLAKIEVELGFDQDVEHPDGGTP